MTDITDAPIFYWHESPGNRFRVDVADFDEAAECAYCVPVYSAETVDRLRARVAKLESAKGEAVAYLHQVVCGDGEPDHALSFEPDNFPLSGVLGYRSLSHVPLYTAPPAPTVDVDAIGDDALLRGRFVFAEHIDALPAFHVMRAALRAIFNKGE